MKIALRCIYRPPVTPNIKKQGQAISLKSPVFHCMDFWIMNSWNLNWNVKI